jgi:hypothetical protein
MPLAFTTVPLRLWASSPAVRWDRRTQTNGRGDRWVSRGVDPCRWLGRRRARRWLAVRLSRCLRDGEVSGEMWGRARPCVAVGARVESREELRVVGGSRARSEERAHRRHQWQTMAASVCSVARKRKKGGGFNGPAVRRGGFSPASRAQWRRHGVEAVGDVRWANGQWQKVSRARACARRPRGTGLGVGSLSRPVASQCPWHRASD